MNRHFRVGNEFIGLIVIAKEGFIKCQQIAQDK